MPNRLTLLYSKIYYKKENYLKVRTVVFKYITPPHNKGHQIKSGYSTPLINNLETKFFKDKNKEKGIGITNLINRIV